MKDQKIAKYSVIDIETTGGHRKGNKITEIAIINFDGHEVTDSFETLINPECSIPPFITKLTGIDNNMVADAPKFYEVAKKIVELTEGRIFVAHNVFFDFNFIKSEFRDLGYTFNREKLCTVRLSRKYLPGFKSYSLGKLCHDLDIPLSNRHRAMGDASATVKLLKKILSKQTSVKDDLVESKRIALPDKVKRDNFELLPDKVGVYYFYDINGDLLYIGKSKNIKTRVASHFRQEMKRKKDIQIREQIAHIDFKLTGNELAALILECQEIKELRPRFNVALRGTKTPISVELVDTQELYSLKATALNSEVSSFYTFKSKRSANTFINSIYKTFLGASPDELSFEQTKTMFIGKFNSKLYNDFLSSAYKRLIPNKRDFYIELAGRVARESCVITVKDLKIESIKYLVDYEANDTIKINDYADVHKILYKYMTKNKLITKDLNHF